MKDRIFIYPSFYLYLQYEIKNHNRRTTSHYFLFFCRITSRFNI